MKKPGCTRGKTNTRRIISCSADIACSLEPLKTVTTERQWCLASLTANLTVDKPWLLCSFCETNSTTLSISLKALISRQTAVFIFLSAHSFLCCSSLSVSYLLVNQIFRAATKLDGTWMSYGGAHRKWYTQARVSVLSFISSLWFSVISLLATTKCFPRVCNLHLKRMCSACSTLCSWNDDSSL